MMSALPNFDGEVEWPCLPHHTVSGDTYVERDTSIQQRLYSSFFPVLVETESPVEQPTALAATPAPGYSWVQVPSSRAGPLPKDKGCIQRSSLPFDHVQIEISEHVAVSLPARLIHGLTRTRIECEKMTKPRAALEQSSFLEKERKVLRYDCPECSVWCTREVHLLDHIIARHVRGNRKSPDVEGNGKIKADPRTILLPQSTQPKGKTDNYSKVYIEKAFRGVSGIFAGFTQQEQLLLSGDVEQNPGPIPLACQWEGCTDTFQTLKSLACHLIIHIGHGMLCQWSDCAYNSADMKQLETHVLKHIYNDTYFHGSSLQQWILSLPSGTFSETCTDLNLCPLNLRSSLNLMMFDEFFHIPHHSYTVECHMNYIIGLPDFEQRKAEYDASRSDNDTDAIQSTSTLTTDTAQGYRLSSNEFSNSCIPAPERQYDTSFTTRPELVGSLQSSVKLCWHDKSNLFPDKRKRVRSSLDEPWQQNISDNFVRCRSALEFESAILQNFRDADFLTESKRHLFDFEKAAFNTASYPFCAEGLFACTVFKYCVPDNEPMYYVRYLESGYCINFMLDVFLPDIVHILKTSEDKLFLCNVATREDISRIYDDALEKQNSKRVKDTKYRARPDKVYMSNVETMKSSLERTKSCAAETGIELCLYILHSAINGFNNKGRIQDKLLFSSNIPSDLLDIQQKFTDYPLTKNSEIMKRSSRDFSEYILPENSNLLDASKHLNYLSSASLNGPGKKVRFIEHFASSSNPASLRNKLVRLFNQGNIHGVCSLFKEKVLPSTDLPEASDSFSSDIPLNPTKKKYVRHERKKVVTREMITNCLANECTAGPNTLLKLPIYDNYKRRLLQSGKLSIQVCNDQIVMATMNDYCDQTGSFKEFEYVHTVRRKTEVGFYFHCTCRIYRTLLEGVGSQELDEFDYLDVKGVMCMHCRFMADEVLTNISVNEQSSVTEIMSFVQKALHDKDKQVITFDGRQGTKKFSVLSAEDELCFVSLTFNRRKQCFVMSCMNGPCTASKGFRRNITTMSTATNMCQHLLILKQHPCLWKDLLADQNDVSDDENVCNTPCETDEFPDSNNPCIDMDSDSHFNADDEQWSFPCLSTHSALKPGDNILAQNTQIRDTWNDHNLKRVNGCLVGPDLVRDIPEFNCLCGCGWTNEANSTGILKFERKVTIYTLTAPVQCSIYTRLCVSSNNPCRLTWDEGQSLSIHVVTRETAAPDEVGWAFVNLVLGSKTTFSSFCDSKTQEYKIRNPLSRSFMDPSVFIKWWFSWASNMKIEFRKPCPVCKYAPKQLACDGTRIGVGFRHAKFTEISRPDNTNREQTLHRRMDRCFFPSRTGLSTDASKTCRQHLHYLALQCLNELSTEIVLHPDEVNNRTAMVMSNLEPGVVPSFHRFCNGMSECESEAYAVVLKMLATTAPVVSLVPPSFAQDLKNLMSNLKRSDVDHPTNDAFFNDAMYRMRTYAPEIRNLIATSMLCNGDSLPDDIHDFLVNLADCSSSLATTDAEEAVPQSGTYNPAKFGRAYYFSPSGRKLRNMRQFTMDDKSASNSTYDDEPLSYEKCDKYLSKTHLSARGTSTLFLWFCPNHGHCYGFHMTFAEGRKDPAASLYTHLEKPPTDIFYDFACNLHEYCLNRESGYYKDVRFFHDIFHGYTHKCSNAYRSTRLLGFETINSEICEQFNSFLQCIKPSARQMTQEHFCFYLQFFLNTWNEKKEKKFNEKLTVALAGLPS